MPLVLIDLDDTQATVNRMIAKSIVGDIIRLSGITDVEVVYLEKRGSVNNPSNPKNQSGDYLRLDGADRLYVEYQEEVDSDKLPLFKTTVEHPPIFQNNDLGIRITPVYRRSIMNFKIEYRSQSSEQLNKWMKRLNYNLRVRDANNYHNVQYNYTIPGGIVAYLYDVWALTQMVAEDGMTWKEFREKYFNDGLMIRSNMTDSQRAMAMNQYDIGLLGFYTDVPTEIDVDKDRASTSVTLGYKIEYNSISFLNLEYQLFIHQQQISKTYVDMFRVPNVPQLVRGRGLPNMTNIDYSLYDNPNFKFHNVEEMFLHPDDWWYPEGVMPGTSTIVISPFRVDLNNRTGVTNIKTLLADPKWKDALEVMELLKVGLDTAFQAPFLVEVFQVNKDTRSIHVVVDSDLNITTEDEMDLRSRHYVRISLIADLSRVTNALKKLQRNPRLLLALLNMLDPNITMGNMEVIGNGSFVTDASLQNIITHLKTTNEQYRSFYGTHRVFGLVQQTNIEAGAKK